MRLRRRDRALVALGGWILCLLSVASAPKDAAATAETDRNFGMAAPSLAEGTPSPILIVRDPFVSETPSASEAPARDAFAPIPGIPVLPPNRAVSASAVAAGGKGPVLRAVLTGMHPCALIEADGATIVVRIGDSLAGRRVEAIDESGVLLSGNMRLRMGS